MKVKCLEVEKYIIQATSVFVDTPTISRDENMGEVLLKETRDKPTVLKQEHCILAAGLALKLDHQVALHEILKIIPNKPEPAICLKIASINPPAVDMTPPG